MKSKESHDEALASPIAVAVPISQHNDCSILTAINTPSLSDVQTDEEARALASASREQGVADIRRHCRQHMSMNPESSYATWIATLHPENARVIIDRRFFIEGNPWLTVYQEAWEDLQKGRRHTVTPSADYPGASSPSLDDGRCNGRDEGELVKPEICSGFLDFGCSLEVDFHMHQMTRKTLHIIGWALGRPVENWDPKRSYYLGR